MTAPNVPFCRVLDFGTIGNDVVAHKRALSRAFPDLYPWRKNFTTYYGRYFDKAVKEAQVRLAVKRTGILDAETHEALEKRHAKNKPTEWAFDLRSEYLASEYCKVHAEDKIRRAIKEAGWYWYARRALIAYEQRRPYVPIKPPQYPPSMDCSVFFTLCHYAGGAPDPNGRRYDGLGYTGTLLTGGTRTSLSQLRVGDAIFYGFTKVARPGFPLNSPTHVALYDGDGMVLTMGSYPMKYLEFDYRSDINTYMHYQVKGA